MTYGSGFEAESGEDAQGDAPTPSADVATASAAAGSVFRQSHRSRLMRDPQQDVAPVSEWRRSHRAYPTAVTTDPIVSFYSGGRDDRGRTLDEIRAWPDERLEAVHDFIQWMFPTVKPSGVNPTAPLVTPSTIDAFARDPALQGRLRQSLERMLSFYGLRRRASGGGTRIEIDDESFPGRAANWLHPDNHNHLRLTRMMESLGALGLGDEARALARCLVTDIYEGPGRERVTPRTYMFWLAAAKA